MSKTNTNTYLPVCGQHVPDEHGHEHEGRVDSLFPIPYSLFPIPYPPAGVDGVAVAHQLEVDVWAGGVAGAA